MLAGSGTPEGATLLAASESCVDSLTPASPEAPDGPKDDGDPEISARAPWQACKEEDAQCAWRPCAQPLQGSNRLQPPPPVVCKAVVKAVVSLVKGTPKPPPPQPQCRNRS